MDSMWPWGTISGERALERNRLRRAWNVLFVFVCCLFGLPQSFWKLLRCLNRWWKLTPFDWLSRTLSSIILNMWSKIFHAIRCGKLTCTKRKKKKTKKLGKLMCSGTNSEVRTFPKTWLLAFLTTNIGMSWWPGSASRTASLSASAMEPRTFFVGFCFVPLLDQGFMETLPYKIILGEHEAMISDGAEGNAEGLELAASSSQPPCLSCSRRTQAPLCVI